MIRAYENPLVSVSSGRPIKIPGTFLRVGFQYLRGGGGRLTSQYSVVQDGPLLVQKNGGLQGITPINGLKNR